MTGNAKALEAAIRHATLLEDDYDAIAPLVTALTTSGDTSLAQRLEEALARLLTEGELSLGAIWSSASSPVFLARRRLRHCCALRPAIWAMIRMGW